MKKVIYFLISMLLVFALTGTVEALTIDFQDRGTTRQLLRGPYSDYRWRPSKSGNNWLTNDWDGGANIFARGSNGVRMDVLNGEANSVQASFKVRNDANQAQALVVHAFDSSWNRIGSSDRIYLDESWANIEFDFDGEPISHLVFRAIRGANNSRFFMDNYTNSQAAPVPEPATIILFGTGFVGLFVYGRKKIFKK